MWAKYTYVHRTESQLTLGKIQIELIIKIDCVNIAVYKTWLILISI